ncbi:MAG TPA: protein kinase, partial [Pyrinomonadaceae bacterium]|nr:protein kinase [Pyrinomonadaceae bacterium]
LGRYEIRSLLGKGGMGEVYLAQDTTLRRPVAVKLLPADFTQHQERLRRFKQEAYAASALNHPNILTVHEIGAQDGSHYIITEFVEGESLRQRIGQMRLELREVLDVGIQTASALAAAHEAGIVHRDIKPENIMLRRDGYVKVLDFGLAKLIEQQSPALDTEAPTTPLLNTGAGALMGTVQYMSPEQARGLSVDARTDIWSLGCVLYEMIAGRPPFGGATTTDTLSMILHHEQPSLLLYSRDLPAEMERIVEKALTKEREERYQLAKELSVDLKRFKQRLEVEAELERTAARQSSTSATAAGSGRRSRKAIDSLAVLPLVNASADPNMEYLSDGITESIINTLSRLPKLHVMARSTVFRYKGRELDPQQVGRELGVRAVLAGTVLQHGDNLHVQAELVDVANGWQLWGEHYDRKPADIFAVQEEIAKEITENLRLRLSGEQKKQLTKRHTENAGAYQLYLKGRYHLNKRTEEGFKKGIEYFQQAIDMDINYALAYAGLSDSYILLERYGVLKPKEAIPQAKAAVLKALEIDDSLAEAHTSLAYAKLIYDWDWLAAEGEYTRAIELNRNYATAHHWYGWHLSHTGRHAEALAEMKWAQELDPLSLIINTNMGTILYFARRYDEAITQLQKTLELDASFIVAHQWLGRAYEQKGMYVEAIAEHRTVLNILGNEPESLASLGHASAVSGRSGEARKVVDKLRKLSKRRYVSPYWIAIIYTGLGEREQAFEWLEKAYEERFDWLIFLKVEPMFDSLRSEARFADLMRRVGLTP